MLTIAVQTHQLWGFTGMLTTDPFGRPLQVQSFTMLPRRCLMSKKGQSLPKKQSKGFFAHFPRQQRDETCFLSNKEKATVWNGEVPKIRRKIRLIRLNWSACRSGSSWGTLRDGWVGWWWDMFQVGHDEKALRMGIWGSPRPPVGWKFPGRPRRHSPSHAHPAHVDDEGGHGVEGMCFVRGMLSKANVAVEPILIWLCLVNTKFLVAFCGRLGFRDGCLWSVGLDSWMLRLNPTIARRPGSAANGDGHSHFISKSLPLPNPKKKQKLCWLPSLKLR